MLVSSNSVPWERTANTKSYTPIAQQDSYNANNQEDVGGVWLNFSIIPVTSNNGNIL